MAHETAINVLGGPLKACSNRPLTGFFRDGHCQACAGDPGLHTVCVRTTAEFLAFSKYLGNDLTTPRPELRFPGLKPGQRWCISASRFLEAHREGFAPPVVMEATHIRTLEIVPMEILRLYRELSPFD